MFEFLYGKKKNDRYAPDAIYAKMLHHALDRSSYVKENGATSDVVVPKNIRSTYYDIFSHLCKEAVDVNSPLEIRRLKIDPTSLSKIENISFTGNYGMMELVLTYKPSTVTMAMLYSKGNSRSMFAQNDKNDETKNLATLITDITRESIDTKIVKGKYLEHHRNRDIEERAIHTMESLMKHSKLLKINDKELQDYVLEVNELLKEGYDQKSA